ncbi:MAG: hypothetical protein ACREIB_02345, partial [Pseudomonadota bacterium]
MGFVYVAETNSARIRKLVPGAPGDTMPPAIAISEPTTSTSYTAMDARLELRGTASDNSTVVAVRWSNDRSGSGNAFGTNVWRVPAIGLANGVNNIIVTAWDVSGNAASARLTVNYSPQQVLLTVAGTGVIGQSSDGIPAVTASLSANVVGLAVDRMGNILFADSTNRRVRKVTPAGVMMPFAGTGEMGSSGDGGLATEASMNLPFGLAIDGAGNVYISDANVHRIRKVAPDGKISFVAGKQGGFGDFSGDGGPATEAAFSGPGQVAVDGQGNLYVADVNNWRVRKINAGDGKINTIAGTGLLEYNGDDIPATQANLFAPCGVAVDAAGNVYIAEAGNQRIRKINAGDGRISTIAGTGVAGYNGDGIPGKDAQVSINTLSYLSLDPAGDLIIADSNNHRIRKLS